MKYIKSQMEIMGNKSRKIQDPDMERTKMSEDTAIYDEIVIKDNKEIDLSKNIAYISLPITTKCDTK